MSVPGWTKDDPVADGINGAVSVVDSLVGLCAQHDKLPPSGPQPERYCYLACVNSTDCFLDQPSRSCVGCDGSWLTEQSAGGAFPVDLQPGFTFVTVLLKDGNGIFQPAGNLMTSGRIHLSVPAACQGPNVNGQCAATMTRMQLASIGTLTIDNQTVSNVHLIDGGQLVDTFVTNLDHGAFSINPPARFGLTGDVTGQSYRYSNLAPSSPAVTVWSWQSRTMSIDVTLESEDGQLAVQLQGFGTFASLPPTSLATANPTSLECGRFTHLSAAGSTDPDGAADIQSVTWTSGWDDGFVWQASGTTVDVTPPLGKHRFYAKVVDSAAIVHTSFVDVTVEDHSPPSLEIAPEVVQYGCAPMSIALAPRLVEDTCDADPPTDLTIVAINGVSTNIPYTPSYLFRFGETTVRYRAVDKAGNEAVAYQTVVLERGSSCCPAGSTILLGTSGIDSLTASSTQPSCLVGLDGADHLYGNLKYDTLLGGRGDDAIEDSASDLTSGAFMWGGIGNDDLRSVSPSSLLSGGPGDDTILYSGSSTVQIRGGAGKDTLTSNTSQETTFILGAACEAVSGEKWIASGPARIESPITVSEILARGVVLQIQGPILFVQTAPLADAECE